MEFLRHYYWIFSSSILLFVTANEIDFEALETDFVEHFGNKEHPIRWSAAKHFYDFKALVEICDQMKVFQNETGVISDLKVNAGEDSAQETSKNPDSHQGSSENRKQEMSKTLKQIIIKNPNLGQNPGVLIFRNKDYKTRMIDVLRCEIANTKHLPSGRRYVYVSKGKIRKSYYLLTKPEAKVNEYLLHYWYKPSKSELLPAANATLPTPTIWFWET